MTSLQTLNNLIQNETLEGGSLEGITFYSDSSEKISKYPAVGTSRETTSCINSAGGIIIPTKYGIRIIMLELLSNHNNDREETNQYLQEKILVTMRLMKEKVINDIEFDPALFKGSIKGSIANVVIELSK